MDRIHRAGLVVSLTNIGTGIVVQRTYSDSEAARRAVRRLEKSAAARRRFWTRRAKA